MTADLILRGGNVITVDDAFSVASTVAVTGDRIVAVGDDLDGLAGPDTRVIDLAGRSVLPGINDAHLHLTWFGLEGRFSVNLNGIGSVPALHEALAKQLATLADDQWLIGAGWREASIAEFGAPPGPHRAALDPVTGNRPTLLHHASRHSVLVNTAALRAAGIDRNTPNPDGGIIVRDLDGEPTGMLMESAVVLATKHIPPFTERQRLDGITEAMAQLNSLGITSVTDPVVVPEMLRDYTTLRRQHRMTVRVNALLHWDWPSPASTVDGIRAALDHAGLSTGLGDDWLRVGGMKLFADGVPTHGTAWMHEPYPDGGNGHLVTPDLAEIIALAHGHRLQVQVHVTGDRAADAAVDAIIAAQQADPWPDARHALIHGTLLADSTLPRLAEHGIGVITSSMLKSHSGASMSQAIGLDRWARTFPAAAMLAAGVHVADSSDAPVTHPHWPRGLATFLGAAPNPFAELAPNQRLTREQAIRLWTTAGAYLEHAEHRKGTIEPGKLADLVVLDGDLLSVEPQALHDLAPVLTIAGGQVVFEAA